MKRVQTPLALTIAGSDPSGGAGIQADVKTFSALEVEGRSVIEALTAQNSTGVVETFGLSEGIVSSQIKAVFEDGKPDSIKTGMLGDAETVRATARLLKKYRVKNLIVDPVMRSTSGATLLSSEGVTAVKEKLLPLALLVTPNIKEAETLAGIKIKNMKDRLEAACIIRELGVKAVLITGGHGKGDAVDLLFDGKESVEFSSPRLTSDEVHGTGCVFSAAITGELAKGQSLKNAVACAKEFVSLAIQFRSTSGVGLAHAEPMAKLYREKERYELLQRTHACIDLMKGQGVGRLIPEVQSNLAVAIDRARVLDDVIGFPGRITKLGDDFAISAPPRFGGSRHVADIVLTAMNFDPTKRAVMNIKYEPEIIKICQKLKLTIASFDRAKEPRKVKLKEGSSLEWGTANAIKSFGGKVPDIIFDEGGMRKEEMIRVIANDIETLTERILKIAKLYP